MSGDALFKEAMQSSIKTSLGNRRFDDNGNIEGLYIIKTAQSGQGIISVDLCETDSAKVMCSAIIARSSWGGRHSRGVRRGDVQKRMAMARR